MTREGAGSQADGVRAGDLILRVTAVVGEIDALKRERHTDPTWHARIELGAIYFKKRIGRGGARSSVAAA